MNKFEDILKIECKNQYIEFSKAISDNLISAYYDYSFLNNLNNYVFRHSIYESFSFKLLKHLVRSIWSDLLLSITKIIEDNDSDNLIFDSFNALIFQNRKNDKINFPPIMHKKFNDIISKVKSCRSQSIAHTLEKVDKIKLDLSSIKTFLDYLKDDFNNRQFEIDGISYLLTLKNIKDIEKLCIKGIKGLFKPSVFEEFKNKKSDT